MKQLLVILLLLGGLLGAALVGYQFLFREDPPDLVTVEKISGSATASAQDGPAHDLQEGDVLAENTTVSTKGGSQVSLKVGDGESVALLPDTQLEVRSVTREGVTFELKVGQVEASVKRYRGRSVAVGVKDNPNVARTREGAMRISSFGDGTMDVASLAGSVELERQGQKVSTIASGNRQVMAINGNELLSGKIPEKVPLAVNWPEKTVLTVPTLMVTGVSTPGSRVTVSGKIVPVDERGQFKLEVALKEGPNQITVQASGMGESSEVTSPVLTVDTSPPRIQTRPDAIWKQ